MAKPRIVEGLTAATPAADAAPRILAVRLAELTSYRDRALARVDPEDLHDLRVATRRLRAALQLVGGVLAQAGPGVKELGDALGLVRDVDVQILWLSAALDTAVVEERPGIEGLASERRAALLPLEANMRRAVERFWTHLAPAISLHLRAAGFPDPLGGPSVRRAVARRLRNVGRRIARLRSVDHVEDVHALRIAAKKARYALELVDPIYGASASNALHVLRPLQELLGDVHDRDVRLDLLLDGIERSSRADQPGLVRLLKEDLIERRRLAVDLAAELEGWRSEQRATALADRLL